jgi:hypothetical protein
MIAIFNLVVLIKILGCTHLARQYIDEIFFQCQNFHEYFLVISFAKYALTLHFHRKNPTCLHMFCVKRNLFQNTISAVSQVSGYAPGLHIRNYRTVLDQQYGCGDQHSFSNFLSDSLERSHLENKRSYRESKTVGQLQ